MSALAVVGRNTGRTAHGAQAPDIQWTRGGEEGSVAVLYAKSPMTIEEALHDQLRTAQHPPPLVLLVDLPLSLILLPLAASCPCSRSLVFFIMHSPLVAP